MSTVKFCPNHMLELKLYEYWFQPGDYECIEKPMHQHYMDQGQEEEKNQHLERAKELYEEARKWNPVDIEILASLCHNAILRKDWETLKKLALEGLKYTYTNVDLARFYRYLGFYYLETYQPRIAYALYRYSNYWNPTDAANQDMEYLRQAVHNQVADLDQISVCKHIMSENQIQITVCPQTKAILQKTLEQVQDMGLRNIYQKMISSIEAK